MKSRLDVWAPLIQTVTGDGNFSTVRTTDKWITCHTIEDVDKNIRRGNALLEVSIADQLYRPRQATLVVANRFQDFRAPNNSTFTHVYKDSDGNDAFSSPNTCLLRQQWGVHSYFFADKMRVRVVDTHTNLVLFAGRIHKIDKKYREGEGAVIELQCADNLELMSAHDLKNLGKEYDFGTGKRRSQLIQAMLNIGYTPQILSTPNKIITGSDINPYLTALNDPDQDIVSSDAGTTSLNSKYSRFEQSEEQISNAVKWTPASSGSSNLLSELLRVARNEPHDDSSVQNKFGYDFYVDPNIGEGNLTATVAPRPQMFNYFKRGNRLSSAGGASQDAADFGLVVKVPVVKTDFSTSHRDSQKAAELMMSGSEFDSPDTSSYTAINLTYSIGEDSYEKVANTGTAESQKSGTHTKKFELIYANQFGTESSSGTELFTWVDKRLDDHFAPNDRMTPGVHSAEWCNLYREDGTTLLYDDSVRTSQRVCRIQFQSTQTSSSNDFGYILISDVGQTYVDSSGVTKYPKWPVINHSSDDYVVLKGQTSGATCRINIEAKDPMEGRPANVWGGERPFAMTQMNIVNPNVLRYDLATRLQSSTSAYHVGKFSIAKAPYYCLDVVSSSIGSASVGSGQSITCTKPAGGGVIDLSNYGVREGMLVTVMTDNQYTTIKEVSNKDIYGYIYNMPDDDEIEVDFTESVALSSNDTNYLRIYIPIRVGDIIVVEDVLSQVLGNHVVTKINYAEQRGTVTQFETLGRNDRVASTQEAPKSITAPPNTVAGRIGKNARETNEQVSDTAHMFEVTHKGDQPVRSKGLTLTFPANNRIEWSGASAQLILPNQEVIQIAESGSGTTSGTSHATYGLGSSGMQTGQLYVMYIDLRADNVLPGEEYNIRTAIYSAYLTVEGDQVIPLLKVRHAGSSGTLPQVDAFLNFIYEGAENLVVTTQAEVIEKAKTFHQDDEPAANVSTHGDLWFKTSDDPITLWMYNTSVNPDAWQKKNDNAPEGSGNKIFRQGRTQGSPSGIPTSENIGDIWIDTDTYTAADGSTRVKNEMYIANVANATTIVTSGNGWYRRDDVDAINNASTSINGGLINTARIILKEGGANTDGLFMTGGATFSPSSGQSYIQMDHTSIKGVSRTGTTDTTQFEIRAEDGKGHFGGGVCTIGDDGITVAGDATSINFLHDTGYLQMWAIDSTSPTRRRIYFNSRLTNGNYLTDPEENFLSPHVPGYMGLGHATTGPWGTIYANIHYLSIIGSAPSRTTDSGWGAMYIRGTNVYVKIGGTEHQVSGGGGGFTSFKWGTSTNSYYTITDGEDVFLEGGGGLIISKTEDNYLKVEHPNGYSGSSGTFVNPSITVNSTGHITALSSGTRIQLAAGSASAPAYSFTGAAANSGMYANGTYPTIAQGGNAKLQIGNTITMNWNRFDTDNEENMGASNTRWGTIYCTSVNESSDERLKENKTPITDSLSFLSRLTPITYNRIGKSDIHFGFTAQEMKQAVLDSGYTTDMGVYVEDLDEETGETHWGITYSTLVAPLVAAIQELKARIEVLEGN